jgi:hypothetical protein
MSAAVIGVQQIAPAIARSALVVNGLFIVMQAVGLSWLIKAINDAKEDTFIINPEKSYSLGRAVFSSGVYNTLSVSDATTAVGDAQGAYDTAQGLVEDEQKVVNGKMADFVGTQTETENARLAISDKLKLLESQRDTANTALNTAKENLELAKKADAAARKANHFKVVCIRLPRSQVLAMQIAFAAALLEVIFNNLYAIYRSTAIQATVISAMRTPAVIMSVASDILMLMSLWTISQTFPGLATMAPVEDVVVRVCVTPAEALRLQASVGVWATYIWLSLGRNYIWGSL